MLLKQLSEQTGACFNLIVLPSHRVGAYFCSPSPRCGKTRLISISYYRRRILSNSKAVPSRGLLFIWCATFSRNPGRQSHQYEVRTHVERSRRHLEPQHVQHASLPLHADSYYLAAAHEPYWPENLSHHDGYRRHRVTLAEEKVPRDQVVLYGSEYYMPQLSKERERDIALRSNYVAESYGRELPTAAASHVMLQPHSLAPSYERTLTYQQYYPITTHQDQSLVYADPLQRPLHGTSYSVEADVPISTNYSYARAPSYR